jgi:hypothetical protein
MGSAIEPTEDAAKRRFSGQNGKTEEIHPALQSSCGKHAKKRRRHQKRHRRRS